ncbi:hypothetical protein [Paracoccus sp. AS002]|uniref:hypothetical protein n=1 Tax=Paracoccus sp. AS002 TaxID=3019545 RepID=UPI0023E80397|nr:hypothetical protein [Paracoccus sp. AS002]MDF3907269.1 hypothetical protein [Paracoccus sp. AS002]
MIGSDTIDAMLTDMLSVFSVPRTVNPIRVDMSQNVLLVTWIRNNAPDPAASAI